MVSEPEGASITSKRPKKIQIKWKHADHLFCSRCGKEFVSRGLRDMQIWQTSNGEYTYVPRDDVLCYECEDAEKANSALLMGGPLRNKEELS